MLLNSFMHLSLYYNYEDQHFCFLATFLFHWMNLNLTCIVSFSLAEPYWFSHHDMDHANYSIFCIMYSFWPQIWVHFLHHQVHYLLIPYNFIMAEYHHYLVYLNWKVIWLFSTSQFLMLYYLDCFGCVIFLFKYHCLFFLLVFWNDFQVNSNHH